MSGFILKIDSLGNAAFSDQPNEEIARILREAAKNIESGLTNGVVRDGNGNKVGTWEINLP